MKLFKKYEPQQGYVKVAGGEESCMKLLELGLLNLRVGDSYEGNTGEREMAIIVLAGKCSVTADNFNSGCVGGRRDVFSGKAASIYIPRDTDFKVECIENVEVALCFGKADRKLKPFVVMPEDVTPVELGVLNLKRGVHSLIDERYETCGLSIGEAFTYPGNWASYPPHKHDISDLPAEAVMEEIYFFKFNMDSGFGFQSVYTEDGTIDETFKVVNNCAVEIPRGYHPFACAPGYYNYMLYIMSGEKRSFYRRTQPCHKWLEAAQVMIEKNASK